MLAYVQSYRVCLLLLLLQQKQLLPLQWLQLLLLLLLLLRWLLLLLLLLQLQLLLLLLHSVEECRRLKVLLLLQYVVLDQLCLVKLKLLAGSELLRRGVRSGSCCVRRKELVVTLESSQGKAQLGACPLGMIVGGLHRQRLLIAARRKSWRKWGPERVPE